jgi:hypothetical protein
MCIPTPTAEFFAEHSRGCASLAPGYLLASLTGCPYPWLPSCIPYGMPLPLATFSHPCGMPE